MKTLRLLTIASIATALVVPQAWALGGGGFAPGGPLSATVSPSCNGFNMDGTANLAPDAHVPNCIDRSARAMSGSTSADHFWD